MDTGVLDDSEGDVWAGAEFAWTSGPFTLQSEIANTALQRKDGEDDANNLWGAYLGARSSGRCTRAAPAPGSWPRAPTTSI